MQCAMFIIIHKSNFHIQLSICFCHLSNKIGEQNLILGFKGLNITFCCLCYLITITTIMKLPNWNSHFSYLNCWQVMAVRFMNSYQIMISQQLMTIILLIKNTSWNSFRWITFKHWWKFTANIRSVYLLSETSDQLPTSALRRAQIFDVIKRCGSCFIGFPRHRCVTKRTHQYNVEDHFVTFYFLRVH